MFRRRRAARPQGHQAMRGSSGFSIPEAGTHGHDNPNWPEHSLHPHKIRESLAIWTVYGMGLAGAPAAPTGTTRPPAGGTELSLEPRPSRIKRTEMGLGQFTHGPPTYDIPVLRYEPLLHTTPHTPSRHTTPPHTLHYTPPHPTPPHPIPHHTILHSTAYTAPNCTAPYKPMCCGCRLGACLPSTIPERSHRYHCLPKGLRRPPKLGPMRPRTWASRDRCGWRCRTASRDHVADLNANQSQLHHRGLRQRPSCNPVHMASTFQMLRTRGQQHRMLTVTRQPPSVTRQPQSVEPQTGLLSLRGGGGGWILADGAGLSWGVPWALLEGQLGRCH